MNVTFDTNCIIALETNDENAPYVRRIIQAAPERGLKLRVVAISASERQPGGRASESFRDFEKRIAGVGLGEVEILLPPLIWDVTYWDQSIWGSDRIDEEARGIHEILFPNSPFEYADYCKHYGLDPAAPDADRKWLNRAVDTWGLWSHMYNGAGVFVTADGNFNKPEKKARLARLGAGQILRPKEASARLCPE